ncbi:hypothetical protein INT48_007007 [Thamnidium elegans]|uniref:Uncharacterized protein n=1 Tax=Thamnidium elegans TaxID=101142 RepID=A0A8H7SYK9_9FUNG|nr:hypothetical protein INT48_007007 [Thamnidium elegans]
MVVSAIFQDTMPDALKESVKSIRPDLAVICTKGVEVGCGELKLLGKAKKLIEIDKARIGTKNDELKDHQLELTKLKFNNGEYEYSLLSTVEFFIRDKYYKDIEVALEALLSFKVICCVKKEPILHTKYVYKENKIRI